MDQQEKATTETLNQKQKDKNIQICSLDFSPSEKKLYLVFESSVVESMRKSSDEQIDNLTVDFKKLIDHTMSTIKKGREQISQSEIPDIVA